MPPNSKRSRILSQIETRSRLYFFFQAEDGIRDLTVTGVQTCALPISDRGAQHRYAHQKAGRSFAQRGILLRGKVSEYDLQEPECEANWSAERRYSWRQIGRASCRERV